MDIKLSKRLSMVYNLVPNNTNVSDVGADHGYLIQKLIIDNKVNKGFAVENKVGPYSILCSNIKENLLESRITCSLSDGISQVPEDFNCVIIAGMGEDTIEKIILDSKDKLNSIEYFVISSHGKYDFMRKFFNKLGYALIDEDACFDNKIYYEAMLFEKGSQELNEEEIEYGKYLLLKKNKAFIKKIEAEIISNNNLLEKNLPKQKKEALKDQNTKLIGILEKVKL